ncbi:MAG: DUF6350 family protein [Corynebacterium sp.]|nr:DUF6350 family protein [Corynebacterium sp.]
MNKKIRPQSRTATGPRSSSRARSRNGSASAAAQAVNAVAKEAKARRVHENMTWPKRIRRMFFVVALPHTVVFAAIAVVALATILLTSSPAAWIPSVIAQSWMVANQAPAVFNGVVISVVPMLLSVVLAWAVAASVYRAIKHRVSINDLLALLGWAVVVPLLFFAVTWFMLWDAGKVYAISPPPVASSLVRLVLFHLFVFALGLGPRLWRALAKRYGVPEFLIDAARLGLRFLLIIGALAAVFITALFFLGLDRQAELLSSYPVLDSRGTMALIGLSVAYVPNVLIAAGGILLGGEFHMGQASLSLFGVHLVPLPPLPILGIIPGATPSWSPWLLLVIVAVLGFGAYRARPQLWTAVLSGVFAGLVMLLLGFLNMGIVGYYAPVGPLLWLNTLLTVMWVSGINLIAAAAFYFLAEKKAADAHDSDSTASAASADETIESATPAAFAVATESLAVDNAETSEEAMAEELDDSTVAAVGSETESGEPSTEPAVDIPIVTASDPEPEAVPPEETVVPELDNADLFNDDDTETNAESNS